ncbi:MAG: hypothetical protein R8K48_07960 [Gallionella sp.]
MYSVLTEVLLVPPFNDTAKIKQRKAHAVDKAQWQDKPYLRGLTLFITSGTLLCCALPILLVSLGFGAVVASLNYHIPGLIFLAEQKLWTLSLSALLLVFLAWVIWRPNQTCPVDPELAASCKQAKKWNQRIFWLSVAVWGVGFFFSLLLLPLRQLLSF